MRDRMGRLILVSLVGAMLTGLFLASHADALPTKGGPAIIDAAWNGTSTLNVVFDAGVLHANWALTDIAFTDTNVVATGSGSGDGDEFITFGSFASAVPDSADSIYISWIEMLTQTTHGFLSNEATPIAVNRGPIIRTATLVTGRNDDPTDDVLTVVLSEAATDLDSTDFLFSADVSDTALNVTGGPTTWTLANFKWASAPDSALQLLPYISTIAWAPGNDVSNAAGDTANSFVNHRIVNTEGDFILDAAYDSLGTGGLGDDTVYVVYAMGIRDSLNGSDAASIDIGDFTIGGTGTMNLTGANPILSTPIDQPWMPWVVQFTNPTVGAALADNIAHSGAGVMQNDMWDATVDVATNTVSLGPIIVASYYKAGTADSVIVHFSQNITAPTVINGAFLIRGFTPVTSPVLWDGGGRRFAQEVTAWTEGAAIAIDLAAANVIDGSSSGVDATSGVWHPVRDLNSSATLDIIQVRTDLVKEFSWAGTPDSSIVRIAWNEASGTDQVHYYRLFTRIGDAVSDTFVTENWKNGVPVFNPTPGLDQPIIAYLNISPDSMVSNGDVIEDGDIIHVGIVGADWNGNFGVINFSGNEQAIALQQTFVAGHINDIRDWILAGDPVFGQDDNVIHIDGAWNIAGTAYDSIYADSGCVEANASVVIYADAGATDTIAVANAGGGGSWDRVDIGFDRGDADGWIYLVAYDGWGNASATLPIVNDVWSTDVGFMSDPDNPLNIYANADSIVVIHSLAVHGDTTVMAGATPTYDQRGVYFNLADSKGRMWADFSNIDTYAGNDSIPFANWLSDKIDNDADWDTTTAKDSYNPGDDIMNWPEPYVDENGNGVFNVGEEFWDLDTGTPADSGFTAKIYDIGDAALDYNDTDEFFFRAVLDTIRASTSVTDESGLPKTGFAVIKDLPVVVKTLDVNENMALDSMLIDLDQVAPEVCYISRIEQQDGLFDLDEETNMREPGLNLYKIGEWVDLTFKTPSDSLVDYVVVQVNNGTGWVDMVLDPPGDHAGDGVYPGTDGYDDDGDGAADSMDVEVLAAYNTPLTDGVDNNNDGQVDNNADTLYAHYWHWDDDEDGMIDGTTIATGSNDGLSRAGTGVDYLPWLLDVANYRDSSGDTLKGLGKNPNGAYGVQTVSAADSSFHWFFQNGFNINMRLVSHLYDLPDSIDFEMRAVAYDWVGQSIGPKIGYDDDSVAVGHWYLPTSATSIHYGAGNRTGNFNPDNSASEKFNLNLEPPSALIDSAAFAMYDVKAAAGTQVFDSFDSTWTVPAANANYTMTASVDDDVESVKFQTWNPVGLTWVDVGTDASSPFVYNYEAPIQRNDPSDNSTDVYFRTIATDVFGNSESPVDSLHTYELMFTVVDGVIPVTNINSCEVVGGNVDNDLSNGCQVPKDSIVIFRITGTNFDDRDTTAWYDIPFIRFEYRKVVQGKASGDWQLMGSVTGTVDGQDTLADLYPPVAVTWNTADTSIVEGDYEIRAWAEDVEGNSNKKTTFIFTATVRETPLRAYIDPPVRMDDTTYALFAKVFIHDIEVDHVDFQYWYDVDANGLADDTGEQWWSISIDDNDDTLNTDPGGDVILYQGGLFGATLFQIDSLNALGGLYMDFDTTFTFVDYDGDGYSERDPVVLDANGDGLVDAGDTDLIGTSEIGDVLTRFDANEFYADVDGSGGLTSIDWIFRHNMGGFLMGGPADSLQVWKGMWNVSGLGSTYLVRSVATDELGNTDSSVVGSEIPVEVVALDTEAPVATISGIALGNGGELTTGAAIDELIVAGDNSFIKIWGTSAATDVANLKFEYSVTGGVVWTGLDVNDDNDFYVDLDDTVGFTAGDAILIDVYDDDTTFTATATDILLRNGIAPDLTAMAGMRIFPLISEDGAATGDADGDGQLDEDAVDAEDTMVPYCVYMDIDAMTAMGLFHTDTHVFLRVTATDLSGNTDPAPNFVSIYIQENVPPETDVIYATSNGDSLDVLGVVADGDAGAQLAALDTLLDLFVTAEDTTTIDSVYLYYRMHDCYYDGLDIFNNPWERAAVDADLVYPYNFAWDISAFTDGWYQFYIAGKDEELNETPHYLNPYEFGRLTAYALIDTAARPLAKMAAGDVHYSDTVLDEVTRGSELWIRAELFEGATAADDDYASVRFYYANRVLGELLTVQSFYPYISDAVPGGGMLAPYEYNTEVRVDTGGADVVCTYYTNDAFDVLTGPTKFDYTIVGGTVVKFGAQLASTDSAYANYNYGSWAEISDPDNDVDENGYFTTAWDPTHPVPAPDSQYTNAYDLIAVASYDFGGACGLALQESQESEGKVVLLISTEGPEVTLHGFYWPFDNSWNVYNYVGNPLTRTNDDHRKSKLCGIEYDAMVVADPDSADIDSVKVEFDDSGTLYDLTRYVAGDTISWTITMNEEDFLLDSMAIWPDSIENVQLVWGVMGDPTYYQMFDDGAHNDGAAGDGWWGVQFDIVVDANGQTQSWFYKFDIDMSGDEHVVAWDPRNDVSMFADSSKIVIPGDFWHRSFSPTEIPNGAHTALAWAWGNGKVGNNNMSDQGPVYFIIDCVDPGITDLYVMPTILGTGACTTLTLVAVMEDEGIEIYDFLALDEIAFQFATDDHQARWVKLAGDTYLSDENGWVFTGVWPSEYYPDRDNIDNDTDGETDEADEKDYTFSLRVVARDDTWNVTIFQSGTVRIDLAPPVIVMTSPDQGTAVAWGETLTVCAEPATAEDAIGLDYYKFYFAESAGVWHEIDPTPIDDGDPNHVPANGTEEVCVQFATNWLGLEQDQYVQFSAVAVDSACNESDHPTPIIVAVNDTTGPSACVLAFYKCDTLSVADAHLAVSGDDVSVIGKIIPNNPDLFSIVEMWVQPEGGTAQMVDVIQIVPPITNGVISFTWNANVFAADGETKEVDVWFLARDVDQNPDPTPLKVRVTIDRQKPTVNYAIVDFFDTKWYQDDDDDPSGALDSTRVIVADPVTGDVTFQIYTADSDVRSISIEYRTASDEWWTLGDWGNWSSSMDFEPQHTIEDGGTTYYYWWRNFDADLVATWALADTIYEWRALATDYACNDNALDPEFETAAWDTTSPECLFYGNDAIADGNIGQVASGSDVTLNWLGTDNLTDVTHAVFWYVEPWAGGDTVIIGSADAVADSIDCPCNKWSAEIVWTTPEELCEDWLFNVYVWAYDTPGNRVECAQEIQVEDKQAPMGTRLVEVTATCLFPRDVTETTLNEQTTVFSGAATLYAVAAGCDNGMATVYFAAVNAAGDTIMIGAVDADEMVAGQYPITWNSLALDVYGQSVWAEGDYTVWVWAVDAEGNVETWASSYDFTIDNTAPVVTMEMPGEAGSTVEVERGSAVALSAVTPTTTEDVSVTWYIRDHHDADCLDGCDSCFVLMDTTNGYYGVDETDIHPTDDNRPYSWDWATWLRRPALEVGNKYDIIAVGEDLTCNTMTPCEAWLAGYGVTIDVFDNTAPCATIVTLLRNVCNDASSVEQPEKERVRGFASLTATVLRGDTDTEGVRFEYSLDEGTTWILADQDLVVYGNWDWTLTNWDSDQIAEGNVLFRAVAWDDAGNVCADVATIILVIDRTAPVLEVVAPVTQTCPFVYAANGHHIVPLIVKVEEGTDEDVWNLQAGLFYEWKKTIQDTSYWSTNGVLDWVYDAGTGYYTGSWDVDTSGATSGKYDFRVTALDSACNETVLVMAEEVVIDVDPPYSRITRVDITRWNEDGEETTVVTPVNQGVVVDITQGEPIEFFATVFDDEQDIPGSLETGVDSVFFEVAGSAQGTWYHIDLAEYNDGDDLWSAHWNTTALEPGDYYVRVRAVDECKNVDVSDYIVVHVIDDAPPRAAVICWKPEVINDINVTTEVTVYATKWCTQQVDEVMFQYRLHGDDPGDGSGDGFAGKIEADGWITFGMQTSSVYDDSLWYATMEIGSETNFQIGDVIDLRAVAITLKPDTYDNRDVLYFDANPPVVTATIVANRFGRDLETVHPDVTPWLAIDKAELIPPSDSDFLVEVAIDSGIQEDWVSIAKPWVLVNAVRASDGWGFEEIVEMDPMNNGAELDPFRWAGFTVNGLLDSIGCGGFVYINAAVVEDSGTVHDEDGEINVDVVRSVIAVHEVTHGLGTNGPVAMPGYDYPVIDIPGGNGVYGGLLMTTTHTPNFPQDEEQAFFIRPIGQSFAFRMLDCGGGYCQAFDDGYWAEVTMSYTDEDLNVTDWIGRDIALNEESDILVAWWDGSHWVNYGISEVHVDTENNLVTFNAEDFCSYHVWSLIGVTGGSNMAISPWCDGYTSRSPVITATITDFMAEANIDEPDIELWIDNVLVGAADYDLDDRDDLDDAYDDPGDEPDECGFAVGNGSFCIEVEEDEEYSLSLRYVHSTLIADRLSGGEHTARLIYRNDDEDYYYTLVKDFMVDVIPVTAEFHGGFLSGPCVNASDCYVGGDNHMIQVELWDYEAGVVTQETRINDVLNVIWGVIPELFGSGGYIDIDTLGFTWNDSLRIPLMDMGLKMDVWLFDGEDDQNDIDEYMERTLIQAATPAMLDYSPQLCEWSDPSQCVDSENVNYYDPSDKLMVSLPLTADLAAYDGREIEVVLYTSKVEHIGFGSNLGGLIDFAGSGGSEDDDEEFTKYIFGPFDCVGNVGSQYIARRFIIDATAPRIVFTTPVMSSVVAPGSEIPIVAILVDSSGGGAGSGINTDDMLVSLFGPKGEVFHFNPATFDPADTASGDEMVADNAKAVMAHVKDWELLSDQFAMTLIGIQEAGAYSVNIEGADAIGNGFVATHEFSTGSVVLGIHEAYVYPNPGNPATDCANIYLYVDGMRPTDVTVRIFDFAGDLVTELGPYHDMRGAQTIEWCYSTGDGTQVASGGYLAHIMVDDGATVKTANVKIAVRRD